MSDDFEDRRPPTVVVIGAGIIGLTCALKIQAALKELNEDPPAEVLLVAKEWPTAITGAPGEYSADYASMWAGAHVRPIPASSPYLRREARWLKQTVGELDRHLSREPWVGITRLPGVEYLENPGSDYLEQDAAMFEAESGLRDYRRIPPRELPEGTQLGFEYETYCINAPLYCSYLLRKFVLNGGKTLDKELRDEWEAYRLPKDIKFVVNASGMGFEDSKCFPIKGQTVITDLVSAKKTVTKQLRDGTWSFIIPRSFDGGTIIGGTKESHSWITYPSMETRHRLLNAAREIIPEACGSHRRPNVIADVVGRRPAREGGMRVEIEEKTDNDDEKYHVIHAYGAGGRGFEMSWGVANEVAELARTLPLLAGGPKARL